MIQKYSQANLSHAVYLEKIFAILYIYMYMCIYIYINIYKEFHIGYV